MSQAIRVRNSQMADWKSAKWPSTYEANRAVCRIKLDANFARNVASTDEVKQAIVDDLRIAKQGGMDWLFTEDQQAPAWSKDVYLDTLKWMQLNGITLETLG